MRVLVVDDSRAMRKILGSILKEFNFEIFEAGNGKIALEVLEKHKKFDLALVDWNMPVMNGYEFVCEVRANSVHNDMKLMMVTTETQIEKVAKALEAGANEYIMKPFNKEIIAQKLQLLELVDN